MYKFLCGHMFLFFLSRYFGVKLLNHMVLLCLTFCGTTELHSNVAPTFAFSSVMYMTSYFLPSPLFPFLKINAILVDVKSLYHCYGLDKCPLRAHMLKARFPACDTIGRWWNFEGWDILRGSPLAERRHWTLVPFLCLCFPAATREASFSTTHCHRDVLSHHSPERNKPTDHGLKPPKL